MPAFFSLKICYSSFCLAPPTASHAKLQQEMCLEQPYCSSTERPMRYEDVPRRDHIAQSDRFVHAGDADNSAYVTIGSSKAGTSGSPVALDSYHALRVSGGSLLSVFMRLADAHRGRKRERERRKVVAGCLGGSIHSRAATARAQD